MVYRIFVEKKPGLDNEARALYNDLRSFLGVESLSGVRVFNATSREAEAEEVQGVYAELPAGNGTRPL